MTKGQTNSSLSAARKAKNDEFYTQLSDVEKELMHYRDQFKGMKVLCNCDDVASAFEEYFSLQFESLGLSQLTCLGYGDRAVQSREYHGDLNKNRMPDPTEYALSLLKGNGDFRNPECVELLKQADIVVTNPPFSLFREYVAQLIEYNKKFLIIGNQNAITYKAIFPLIKDGKLWLGYGHPKVFVQPDGEKKSFGNICWFTNLDVSKRHDPIVLYKTYSPKEYPKYDNYDAINVDKVAEIPMDYMGVMGVPITFLDKHCPEQFEILGEMVSTTVDNFNFGYPFINGKKIYARIIIKRR